MAAKKDNTMMNLLLVAAGAYLVWEYILKPQQAIAALPPAGQTTVTPGAQTAPPAATPWQQLVQDSASSDTLPMNLWRWNWHYEHATGNSAPDVHLGKAFPGQSVKQVEAQVLSFQQWLTLATQYAVNPETQAIGGWDPATGLFSNAGLGRASALSRTEGQGWGQGGSGQFSQWAGGTARRYRPQRPDVSARRNKVVAIRRQVG